MEKAAIDYAISQGVIIVASAGNEGKDGMGYPGAYTPVISVAASGWTREWWRDCNLVGTIDVPDPTKSRRLLHHRFLQPPACRAGSRRCRAGLVGRRTVPAPERQDILLLPRRHLDGVAARRWHRRADGAEERGADAAQVEGILEARRFRSRRAAGGRPGPGAAPHRCAGARTRPARDSRPPTRRSPQRRSTTLHRLMRGPGKPGPLSVYGCVRRVARRQGGGDREGGCRVRQVAPRGRPRR